MVYVSCFSRFILEFREVLFAPHAAKFREMVPIACRRSGLDSKRDLKEFFYGFVDAQTFSGGLFFNQGGKLVVDAVDRH